MLKQISIRIHDDEIMVTPYFYTGSIEELYYNSLVNTDCKEIQYINIYFTNLKSSDIKIESKFLDKNIYFDFPYFENLKNNYDKKKYILDILHSAILNLSIQFGWDSVPFEKAYQTCLEKELLLGWVFKNKLFISPGKNHFFGLLNLVDIGKYEIFGVLFNSKKLEIARHILFEDSTSVFNIDYASWENFNDRFFYKFKGPKKVFEIAIKDIIENKKVNLNQNTSNFFKSDNRATK